MCGVFICVAKELLNDLSAVWVSLGRIIRLCFHVLACLGASIYSLSWRSHALERAVAVTASSHAYRFSLSGQLSVQYKDLIESVHGIGFGFPITKCKAKLSYFCPGSSPVWSVWML
jgi:hypothetical protein